MAREDEKSVLVVSDDPVDTGRLDASLADASVELLTEPTSLFDVLTRSPFHCLVVPSTIDGQSGTDVAYGVTALFPDLPVVVSGVAPSSIPDGLDVVAVESSTLVGQAVADAVRDALAGDPPAVAGRPPSPMETLLLSLFNEMPDHLYAKDDAARHVLMGRGFNEPTDRLGLTDPEVDELTPEHSEAAYHDEMDVIENDERIEVEEFLDLDASYVRTCKVPWYDADGEVQGLVGLTHDITERKASEHASRRQHERMVKVALVAAHELRNELQVAHGCLAQLADEGVDVGRVEESLWRLSSIVDTVVGLSNTETEGQEPTTLWLSRLAREVWDTIGAEQAALDVEADARVVADQESAGLLLHLLFQNAVEQSDSHVTVTVGTTPDGFFVADDGPGIDATPPERVFDAGYTTVEGNTGYGLYVARMVAEDLGWSISLSAGSGDGTRFDVGNVAFVE